MEDQNKIGRSLRDIKSNLEGEDLLTDAQAVLDSLAQRASVNSG